MLALTTAAALLASCSRSPSAADTPLPRVSLQADWYAEAEQGGYYQALAKGYYREAGLDVTIMNGGPGGFPLQKVAAGTATFALGRSDDVILAVSRGHLPLLVVGAYMEKDPMAVVVHDESSVRDFPDMAGKVVMVDPASAWVSYLKAKYAIDFSIVPLNYGLSQFMGDPNLIQQAFATNEPYFFGRKGVRTRTLLIANSGYRPYRVVIANAAYARAHPDVVRAFVSASLRGWRDFIEGDPAPAKKLILAQNEAMTEDFMAFSTRAMIENHFIGGDADQGERLGLMTARRMQEQVDVFVRLKVIPEPLPLDAFVSFSFLPPELASLARN